MRYSFANVIQETKKCLKSPVYMAVMCALLSVIAPSHTFAFTQVNAPNPPDHWTVVGTKSSNVHIYQNNGDVVALVDLAGGARVKMLQYQSGVNQNGHNTFWTNTLDYWWNQLPSNSSRALVVNGQFFNANVPNRQTTLSYSVRSETWATLSGDPNNHNHPLRQIAFFSDGVLVENAIDDWWVQTSAPDGLLGRSPYDVPSPGHSRGRTALCAMQYKNQSRNRPPILMITVAKSKTQAQMNSMLQGWGCNLNWAIAMDGSGSSQMKTRSGHTVYGAANNSNKPDYREFPQAIGVFLINIA